MCSPAEKGGAGYTQTQLAERLGCKQAHISNRVRLLELPAEWQDRVNKGELPPTHARRSRSSVPCRPTSRPGT